MSTLSVRRKGVKDTKARESVMGKREKQRFLRAYAKACTVFDSEEDALGWLSEPSLALGNAIPKKLLTSDKGLSLVLYELAQMEFGHPV